MRLTFVAPSAPVPIGGVAVIYEMASALARRGHDVHLYHVNFLNRAVSAADELDWFPFPDGISRHFAPDGQTDPGDVPEADVIFGVPFDAELPRHAGLPAILIQGYRMVGLDVEHYAYRAPCPKICVAGWLLDVGRDLGVPDDQLVHIPIGLRHDTFRLTRPIEARPKRVTYCYNDHWNKGAPLALDVLSRVKRSLPDVEVVLFGAASPVHDLPDWVRYFRSPPQRQLVDEIYNSSRVFLCTSKVEGFGLPNVEAMACGAALVTTDNGGSRDFAAHGRTALVAPFEDPAALATHVIALLEDESRRISIATAGYDLVQRFDWERTGELLEAFLERYIADPAAYGHPLRSG